jgi:hypothetical protein
MCILNTPIPSRQAIKIKTVFCQSSYYDEPLKKQRTGFLILSFRRVHNVVSFLLGDSPASVFYMPTFRNSLSVPSS